jgi:hypothetical protein
LPFEFQNVSSSGFHSEIQVGSLLIGDFLSQLSLHQPDAQRRALGRPPVRRCQNSNDWFPRTASMASAQTIQASCQATATQKVIILE